MSKERRTAILEDWFAIDKILFGNSTPQSKLSEEAYNSYLSCKGAFLSNLFEIYTEIDFKSPRKYKNAIDMIKKSKSLAEGAIVSANKFLKKDKVGTLIKEEIKEIGQRENLSESQVGNYVISRRRNAIAIDSLVMNGVNINENSDSLKNWKGNVLIEAHKVLRDQLIDLVL